MERKKFILFDNTPVNDYFNLWGGDVKTPYSSFTRFGNKSVLHGEDSATAIDFSLVTHGMGFYSEGGLTGDNIIQNSDFDPSGTSAWDLSVGSNADATPTFGPDDFSHQFETTSSALFGGGYLKMRAYAGAGNIAPFVAQNIVLGDNLGLVTKTAWTKWYRHSGFQAGAEIVRNPAPGGSSLYADYKDYPSIRVTYNGNSTDYYPIANSQPFRIDTPQTEANIQNYSHIPASDIAALGASAGDTVSIELHAVGPVLETQPKDYEVIFDSFEVYESIGASLGFYSINPYECTDYLNFFEGVSVEEGLEDMIKVLEASSSLGESGNKEAGFVEVEDLGLNSRKAYGFTGWIN